MAVLTSVKIEKTSKPVPYWERRQWPNGPQLEYRETKKSFVTLWQLANTLDDVWDSLNAAGCGRVEGGRVHTDYLGSLKAKATRLRNLGVPLKELKSVAEINAEAAVVTGDDLRKIAIAIEETGKVPK